MKAAVFYATREGQAQRVAERVASDLRAHLIDADVINVRTLRRPIDWPAYAIGFVVASVHAGSHEKEMIEFVTRSTAELTRLHAPFLSLTLSEAGAALASNSVAQREAARADALRMIDEFVQQTGWQPSRCLPVAGALMYSKYNVIVKWVMKRIAHKAGFDGPTTRDYEFTNWRAVDQFVAESAPASA
jgi:menaquinone-dependent protoporphyrinogen oxidase